MTGNHESYFNMWRAVVAMTTIDGVITEQEKEWLEKFLSHGHLTDEEKLTIREDMKSPSDPEQYINLITDSGHLSQLHHLSNIIFNSDDFDYKEKKYLEKIQKIIESKIDVYGALKVAEDYKAKLAVKTREEKSAVKGIFLTLVEYFRNH